MVDKESHRTVQQISLQLSVTCIAVEIKNVSLASALLLPDQTRETFFEFPSSLNCFSSTILFVLKDCFSKMHLCPRITQSLADLPAQSSRVLPTNFGISHPMPRFLTGNVQLEDWPVPQLSTNCKHAQTLINENKSKKLFDIMSALPHGHLTADVCCMSSNFFFWNGKRNLLVWSRRMHLVRVSFHQANVRIRGSKTPRGISSKSGGQIINPHHASSDIDLLTEASLRLGQTTLGDRIIHTLKISID